MAFAAPSAVATAAPAPPAVELHEGSSSDAAITADDVAVSLEVDSGARPAVEEAKAAPLAREQADEQSCASAAERRWPSKALRTLGVERDTASRCTALRKLGLTEDHVRNTAPLFVGPDKRQRLARLCERRYSSSKITDILGVTEEQLLRGKALRMLGTTEAEVEELRSLALAGREARARGVRRASTGCIPCPASPM